MVMIAPNFGSIRRVTQPVRSFGEKIKRGSFSRIDRVTEDGDFVALEWHSCRDTFHVDSARICRMLFCHTKDRSYQVASFINMVEKRLGVELTEFGPTQRNDICWLNVSSWWTSSSMRRSLFTILLRASQAHKEENSIEATLFLEPYARFTSEAIDWFFRGHTKYTGRMTGWYAQFRYGEGNWENPQPPNPFQIRKLLVRP